VSVLQIKQFLTCRKKIIQVEIFVLSLILFIISGCGLIQDKNLSQYSGVIDNKFPDNWEIRGRISVKNEKKNWYAKFNWVQEKEDFQISFTGPFGETELQISQTGENILLKTPAYERSGKNLEKLLFQETGWFFPVTSLRYWSYGSSNPHTVSRIEYNELQQISDIVQAGWHIEYTKRMLVDQYLLPKKIIVLKNNLKIKIVITSWKLENNRRE
jgi:outer membrane lipoprotein LolB